jgi:integrase/recombinase XerD
MRTWPARDETLIRQYVQTLPLRSPSSQAAARSRLRRFQQFVTTHAPHAPLSQTTLQVWLHDLRTHVSLRSVIASARRVEGFLEWLVGEGILTETPWPSLRATYGHRIAPIVRALLEPNPREALDALRPLPRFGSHLGPAMRQHLAHRRSLGFRYEREAERLLNFDRYLQRHPGADQLPVHVLVREYAECAPTPEARLERWQSGRTLAQGMQRHDPTVTPPPLDRFISREALRQRRQPYIYTVEEVQRLLAAALAYPSPHVPLRPHTLSTSVLLAYCTGLRLGELVRLTLGDLDLNEATLTVRNTKYFKSRQLPLRPSLLAVLRDYLQARAQSTASDAPTAALLWNEHKGQGYQVVTLGHLLAEVIRQADLKPQAGRLGPRFHDLRHTFVVHRMVAWYRAGINPQSRLHYLATYLGHKDIYSTLVYLTITQELLQEANTRFHAFGAQVLDPTRGDVVCHP